MGDLTKNDIVEQMQAKLANPANIKTETYEELVNEAVVEYSRHKPQVKVADTTGADVWDYALPTGWVTDFSNIISIEYPFNSATQDIDLIKEGVSWLYYQDTTSVKIRFLGSKPSASETFRVTYTLPHTVDNTSSTVNNAHERSVVNYAAALLAEVLAAEFEKKGRSSLPEGTFDLRTKAQEYHAQADRYYKRWRQGMGIPEDGGPRAASESTDTDWKLSTGDTPLTHARQ